MLFWNIYKRVGVLQFNRRSLREPTTGANGGMEEDCHSAGQGPC